MMDRRHFCLLSAWACPGLLLADTQPVAGRGLVFRIGSGFGDASPSDIGAVLRAAAESIWQYCPNTRWEVPGFDIYRSGESPVTDFAHRRDGSIAIGLKTEGNHWAQFAFQFAHEFCHALAGHSNDWNKPWIREPKANHWLEETLCETASLFALRAMARRWETKPPYPNWKDYVPALAGYAKERLDAAARILPVEMNFNIWFRDNEPSLRKDAVQRDKNGLIASRLLPLFEAEPAGWESLTCYNLGPRVATKSLLDHFRDWRAAAPQDQRSFIGKLERSLQAP